MCLSIHYSGCFNPTASLPEMVEEITDIVSVVEWPYQLYSSHFPTNKFDIEYNTEIYGISFTPPYSETISFCFLSNGRMSNAILLRYFGKDSNDKNEKLLYSISSKTQYAGINVHIFLINLFRYISKKYLIKFELTDEGQYWETRDENLLSEIFATYNSYLESVSIAFQSFPIQNGETFAAYFERVLKSINKL